MAMKLIPIIFAWAHLQDSFLTNILMGIIAGMASAELTFPLCYLTFEQIAQQFYRLF